MDQNSTPGGDRPIIIIPYVWIGDFVRCHSVVKLLREQAPGRPIDIVSSTLCAPLADYMPGVRNTIVVDLLVDSNRNDLLDRLKSRTVFNCVGYGGYSFEAESDLIFETNFNLTTKLLRRLGTLDIACYVRVCAGAPDGVMRQALAKEASRYINMPFYRAMFDEAGFAA
ncbi:MAG: hypothetical protein ABI830_05050, partial [Pseudolabrys sp.]